MKIVFIIMACLLYDLKKLSKSIDMICEQLRAVDDEMVHRDEGEGS